MTTEAKCPLCGVPIKVMVDPEYAKLGDPYSLKSLASRIHCIRCVRFLRSQSRLKEQIRYMSFLLTGASDLALDDRRITALRDLLKTYLNVLNGFYVPDPKIEFDPLIIDMLKEHPEEVESVLSKLEQTVKNAPKQSGFF